MSGANLERNRPVVTDDPVTRQLRSAARRAKVEVGLVSQSDF